MNKPNITAGTITRTVLLGVALVNQVMTTAGKSPLPIDNEVVTQVITVGFTAVASVVAWWKNNSFTQPATQGDLTMNKLKKQAEER